MKKVLSIILVVMLLFTLVGCNKGTESTGSANEQPTPPSGNEMPNGEAPEMPNGEAPQMPNGEAPQMPNGEAPQMPNGEMPNGNGEMNGGFSAKPDGYDEWLSSDETIPEEYKEWLERMKDMFGGNRPDGEKEPTEASMPEENTEPKNNPEEKNFEVPEGLAEWVANSSASDEIKNWISQMLTMGERTAPQEFVPEGQSDSQ